MQFDDPLPQVTPLFYILSFDIQGRMYVVCEVTPTAVFKRRGTSVKAGLEREVTAPGKVRGPLTGNDVRRAKIRGWNNRIVVCTVPQASKFSSAAVDSIDRYFCNMYIGVRIYMFDDLYLLYARVVQRRRSVNAALEQCSFAYTCMYIHVGENHVACLSNSREWWGSGAWDFIFELDVSSRV